MCCIGEHQCFSTDKKMGRSVYGHVVKKRHLQKNVILKVFLMRDFYF